MTDGPLVRYMKSAGDDISLFKRAIAGGWPISDDQRKSIVDQLMNILNNSNNESERVKAARVLTAARASDRFYEIEIMRILQRDQTPTDALILGPRQAPQQAEEDDDDMDTDDVHRRLEQTSQFKDQVPRSDELGGDDEEDDD